MGTLGSVQALPLLLSLALSGTVLETSPEASTTVWLTDTPDLTAPHLPLAEATASVDGSWSLEYAGDRPIDRLWVFVRQSLSDDGDGPLVFWLPHDVLGHPVDELRDGPPLSIRALPVEEARMQRGGERPEGWFVKPIVMTAVILLGPLPLALLVRLRQRRLGAATGPPRGPPSLPPTTSRERTAIGVVLAVAAAARTVRLGEPLELLEHAYGPGLPGINDVPPETLMQAILEPPSLIVTHPPLYHWAMAALGRASGWNEVVLRLPALAASVATAWVLWRLLRRVDPVAGVAAAAAWAVCSPGVFYGGDASPYAFVGFVCAASVAAALRAFESGSARAWLLWAGLLAAGFLCHYTTAIFGVLQGVVVLAAFARRRADPNFNAALARLLVVIPVAGLLPALWTWPHFATFDIVGLDTRLMSESYPVDPGMHVFMREVVAVLCGVSPRMWPAAALLLVLAGRGLALTARRDGLLAALVAANLVAGVAGVFFFYLNHIAIMHGRIFWGFRWVSWAVPLSVAVAAVGATASREGAFRIAGPALGVAWLGFALHFTLAPADRSTRPDYAEAAAIIAAELDDRDGVATLPMWGQRGPLLWYLMDAAGFDVRDPGPELPKRIWLNPTHEQLPFATSAWNGHVDRLWIARVDERMFGRPKFLLELGDQGLAWAQDHLEPDGVWELDHLTLYRFRRPAADGWDGAAPLILTSPLHDVRALRFQEPNKWYCGQVSEYPDVASSQGGWMLHLRVPLQPGVGPVNASVTDGELHELEGGEDAFAALVVGGRCDSTAPRVELRTGPP